jgi:AraC family transcriptional regulator
MKHVMRTPGSKHRTEYDRRLHKVLAHIDAHLDEPLVLGDLARVANFSEFHFHRIFSAHVGETFGSYLTRRRIEQAAARLASQPRLSVFAVAVSVGFGSPEAFTRAFKKRYGCSPSAWKKEPPKSWLEESKPGQVNRKPSQEVRARKVYGSNMAHKTLSPLRVDVKTRAPVRIAYLRYQGPYGAPVGRFWQEEVYPWMVANNLLGAARYGVSHDDPQTTEKSKCRYDAGVEVGPAFVPSQNAQIGTVPGGLYACTAFKGTSSEIPYHWEQMLREWLPASGYQLDARPSFEYYPPDGEYDEKTGAFTCELCSPLAKL